MSEPPPNGQERLVTAEEFLEGHPDAFGEIHDGVLIQACGQSPQHGLVVRRLAAELEYAVDPDGPRREVYWDTPIRVVDAERAEADRRVRVRHPDLIMRDGTGGPYDLRSVAREILLVVEVTSASTIGSDIGLKRELYASEGIPVYLIVHFDRDWQQITEIEECRLDWSGCRYVTRHNHTDSLVLTEPVTLTVAFADLQSRLPRRP
ncbi:Uma2 family endonuclease [Nocardia sp. NPDC051832]|uniref:Uma2 family endonuclease n=1 Tax=Nocardia sp. NPDC051832 TaxID=3155673 RepID=UPI003426F8C5